MSERDWFEVLAALAVFDETGDTRPLRAALDGAEPDTIPEGVRLIIADAFIRRVQHPRKRGRRDAILRDNSALRAAVADAFERAREAGRAREAAAKAVQLMPPFDRLGLTPSAIFRAAATLRREAMEAVIPAFERERATGRSPEAAADAVRHSAPFKRLRLSRSTVLSAVASARRATNR